MAELGTSIVRRGLGWASALDVEVISRDGTPVILRFPVAGERRNELASPEYVRAMADRMKALWSAAASERQARDPSRTDAYAGRMSDRETARVPDNNSTPDLEDAVRSIASTGEDVDTVETADMDGSARPEGE